MLAAAIILVQGWQGRVQFEQSMKDLNSKIQQYAQDVSSGFFPGSSRYGCTAVGGRPQLNNNPQNLADCVFLGKAIGAAIGSGSLNIYTVLGDRVIPNGSPNAGQPVSSFNDANPTAMNQPGYDLTDSYPILWGATVTSSKVTYVDNSGQTQTTDGDLVGFYNDLQNSNLANAQYVLAKAYTTTDLSQVQTCVQQNGGCANYVMQSWQLCLASNNSSRRALLTTAPSGLGVSTKLTMGGC